MLTHRREERPGQRADPISRRRLLHVIPKKAYSGMTWRVEFLDDDVLAELEALPLDFQASFLRITRLIEAEGLHRVRDPYVKHLEGPLWEMRMKGRDGIARATYVTASGRRVVVSARVREEDPKDAAA